MDGDSSDEGNDELTCVRSDKSWSGTLDSQPAGDSMHSNEAGSGLLAPPTRPTATLIIGRHAQSLNPEVGCHYFYHAHSYLSSRRVSPPFGHCQLILLGDRGTQMWETCPEFFTPHARPRLEPMTSWSQVCRSTDSATTPPLRRKRCVLYSIVAVFQRNGVSCPAVPVPINSTRSPSDMTVPCSASTLSHVATLSRVVVNVCTVVSVIYSFSYRWC